MSSNQKYLREVVFQADNSMAIFFSIITQIQSIHMGRKTTKYNVQKIEQQ